MNIIGKGHWQMFVHGNKLIVANYPCAFFGKRNKMRNFASTFQKQSFFRNGLIVGIAQLVRVSP